MKFCIKKNLLHDKVSFLPVYSKNGDEGVDCDEDADDV